MQSKLYGTFKTGLHIGARSFSMLWHHPALLLYYLGLIVLYAAVYIVSFNLVGYLLPELSSEATHQLMEGAFLPPDYNLLSELISQNGGLIYIAYLLSIFFNIVMRTFVGCALIVHTYRLLHQRSTGIKLILHTLKKRWLILTQWSLVVSAVTLGSLLISNLPVPAQVSSMLTSATGILWSVFTFFVLPILSLTSSSMSNSIVRSTRFVIRYSLQMAGALLWLTLSFILLLSFIRIVILLIHDPVGQLIAGTASGALLILLFETVLPICKTVLYDHITQETPPTTPPDYSQF